MYETVTVDQAISRGQKMINLPVFIIIFGIIGLSVFLGSADYINPAAMICGIVSGFLAGWLYWSVMIAKWKLWAFENVRNVHELQRKAIEGKLIWDDGSIWNKTVVMSAADKAKWASLQTKFDQPDFYADDIMVPQETLIYYSRGIILFQIVFITGLFGVGIYLFSQHQYIFGAVLSVFAIYLIYSEYKRAIDKSPQIILNEKGIETKKAGFNEWKDVSFDEVVTESSGKTTITYLKFNYPGGEEKLNIGELDTNKKALEHLLQTYRVRSEKGSKH